MNDIKLKPFDLQKAMKGEPVILRNGQPYKFGAYNPDAEETRQIIGWVRGDNYAHSADGLYCYGKMESDMDLFMAPQEKELWIAVSNRMSDCNRESHATTYAYIKKEDVPKCMSDYQIIKITIQQ